MCERDDIDVVYIATRPSAVGGEECKPVCHVSFVVHLNVTIPVRVDVACYIASLPRMVRGPLPDKYSRRCVKGYAGKKFNNFNLSWICHPRTIQAAREPNAADISKPMMPPRNTALADLFFFCKKVGSSDANIPQTPMNKQTAAANQIGTEATTIIPPSP